MAKIAMLVGPDFEDSEFRKPYDAFVAAGHEVLILGPSAGREVRGKKGDETVTIEKSVKDVQANNFDALVIPGGYSPDHLRTDSQVVRFVKEFDELKRPLAAVCHGPQLLIEADVVKNRQMTSWPSVRKDLENAGARWVDQQVCEDGVLITSRRPDDLEAFSEALLRRIAA